MMREIKFRAKMGTTPDWLYGGGVWTFKNGVTAMFGAGLDGHPIVHEVNQETVGQFTGLRDSYGREIYDGDIVGRPDGLYASQVFPAEDYERHGQWCCDDGCVQALWDAIHGDGFVVIGNIYEDRELLRRVR
jgi:hypothetical protein